MKKWQIDVEAPDGNSGDGWEVEADTADEAEKLGRSQIRAGLLAAGWDVVAVVQVQHD